jgi:hypothetical protein
MRLLGFCGVVGLLGLLSATGDTTATFAQDPTGEPTAEVTMTLTPIGGVVPTTICENAPTLRLSFGKRAQVIATTDPDAPGAALKPEPDTALPARYLPLKTAVTVVTGPKCDAENNQWWLVRAGELEGWVPETVGQAYILEPVTGAETPPLATTLMLPISCVKANEPTLPPTPGDPLLRVVFADDKGRLVVSDDNDPVGRVLNRFDPPPTGVDIAPDGTIAAVVNRNGVYWVNIATGDTVLLLDATTLELNGRAWTARAIWLPGGRHLAVEVEDRSGDAPNYALYTFPLDGSRIIFRADGGAQPANSLRRSPPGNRLVMLSANDISAVPVKPDDDTPLLEFVPISEGENAAGIYSPAISWSPDGTGFYTYIPAGQLTAPDDPVANRLWYVPFDGEPKDLGTPPNITPGEYVIPAPDGAKLLLGRGGRWRLQEAATGKVLATLPAFQFIFDWTPDSQGAIYTDLNGRANFLGVDGGTSSAFLPTNVSGLYGLRWLSDGTILFVTQEGERFNLNLQRPGQQPISLVTLAGLEAFSGMIVPGKPSPAIRPERCE